MANCYTGILQIECLKSTHYRGNLNRYLELNPEARAFLSLKECKLELQRQPFEIIWKMMLRRRTLSSANVEKHLADCDLEPEVSQL